MNQRILHGFFLLFLMILFASPCAVAAGETCSGPSVPPQAVSLTTGKALGEELSLHINSGIAQDACIDFGDGQLKTFSLSGQDEGSIECTGIVRGAEIKVYAEQLTVFSCSSYNKISRIAFTGDLSCLEYLTVFDNNIKTISLSGMVGLKELGISSNPIEYIDLTPVGNLERFHAVDTKLRSIELGSCKKMKNLDLSQIKTLQEIKGLGELSALEIVEIKNSTPVQSLDLSSACRLTKLTAGGTKLASVSIPPGGTANRLRYLYLNNACLDACVLNKLFENLPILNPASQKVNLAIAGNPGAGGSRTETATGKGWKTDTEGDGTGCAQSSISLATGKAIGKTIKLKIRASGEITIDGATGTFKPDEYVTYTLTDKKVCIRGEITELDCRKNQLTALDISNCPMLRVLDCGHNQLTTLDPTKNTALTDLSCEGNRLDNLDISKNLALTALYCWKNQLTTLNLSRNTALKKISCYLNLLTTLDPTNNPDLAILYCRENQLSALDLSKNSNLTELNCPQNRLDKLDISSNPALEKLICHENNLHQLDVSQNPDLIELYCQKNRLTALDLNHNALLRELNCSQNQLTTLDLSKNTELTWLFCFENKLDHLEISKNPALSLLSCRKNRLTALDVSKNTALSEFACEENRLTRLNIMGNKALTSLHCHRNQIRNTEMEQLVNALPPYRKPQMPTGYEGFCVIDSTDPNEQNVCTKNQVAFARAKGWTVYDFNGSWKLAKEYEGSSTSVEKIAAGSPAIYPNPANDFIRIEGAGAHAEFRLYTLSGRQVFSGKTDDSGTARLALKGLTAGSYLLQTTGKHFIVIVK